MLFTRSRCDNVRAGWRVYSSEAFASFQRNKSEAGVQPHVTENSATDALG